MGGKSEQAQTSQSTTKPWDAAQPALQGILGQLQGQLGNTGLTGAENSALNQLSQGGGNQFAGQINDLASTLFGGGGATAQSGNISQAYQDYQRRLNPIADGANIGPGGNPALKGYLDTIGNDVQQRVNGMFAGAGRDFSGMNQRTLSRGLAEGMSPVLAAQYNTDVNNQRSAADALYNGGNATAGLLSGLNQQALANRQAGVGVAQAGVDAQNSGARAQLEAEAMRRGIPTQALGLLAQIGIPIAGLGQQTNGSATGTNQMSGVQQFMGIANGISSLGGMFGGGSNSSANGLSRFLLG